MHQKNGCFFIRFVTFTSTLVHSVVWNQSLLKLVRVTLNAVIHIFPVKIFVLSMILILLLCMKVRV